MDNIYSNNLYKLTYRENPIKQYNENDYDLLALVGTLQKTELHPALVQCLLLASTKDGAVGAAKFFNTSVWARAVPVDKEDLATFMGAQYKAPQYDELLKGGV